MSRRGVSGLHDRRREYVTQEIADASMRLFAESGFDAVTVDEIAAEVGISARTFFRYFPTKDDVLLQHHRRIRSRLVRAMSRRPPDEGAVTALRNAYLETSTVSPERREEIARQTRFLAGSRALVAKAHGAGATEVAEVAELVAGRLGISPDDARAETIAVAMDAAAGAAFRRWALADGAEDPAIHVAAALDLLAAGLEVSVAGHR